MRNYTNDRGTAQFGCFRALSHLNLYLWSPSIAMSLVLYTVCCAWVRYFSQAEQQLPVGLWQLMKSDFGNTPTLTQFLKQETKSQLKTLGTLEMPRLSVEAGIAITID